MSIRHIVFTAAITLALASAAAGCGSPSETGTGGSGTTTTGGGGTGGSGTGGSATGGSGTGGSDLPKAPTLGAQIDRMGRPAINTAVNHTFDINPEQKDQAKDAWNANKDSATWANYVAEIEKNLAVLDSLDQDCGNQALADATKDDPSRYAGLAGVLADDRLYVNTENGNCSTYLAVEADAAGLLPNNDCGGRRLSYDVIETSYSLLAAGILAGVDDEVPISEAAKGEVFPHLADPH